MTPQATREFLVCWTDAMAGKECPWCTIILVSLCMVCHVGVWYGNMQTANGFDKMGASADGWSKVGLAMAESFREDIDNVMSNMTEQLTEAIEQIEKLEESIDDQIAAAGKESDSLLQVEAHYNRTVTLKGLPTGTPKVAPSSKEIAPKVMAKVGNGLDLLLDKMEPLLLKVGEWDATFGDKVQAGVEQFGTSIDIVQKMFDQIMSEMNPESGDPEYMRHNTYTLFAVTDPTVGITVQDLKDVADIYSISALQGAKGEQMHLKYDANKDAVIDEKEYMAFVEDGTITNVMATVLRSYAKRLAEVAGRLSQARLRDEVANAVTKYLQLVCAKNITKVGWISEMLTNNTLPLPFTADVMKNLALSVDDPEVITTADVGSMVVGTMIQLDQEHTMEAVDLMSSAEFWESEGFDPADQPICVQRVSKWAAVSLIQTGFDEQSASAFSKLHQHLGGSDSMSLISTGAGLQAAEAVGMLARVRAERNQRAFCQERHRALTERHKSLFSTVSGRHLFTTLLGGATATSINPLATAAVNGGVPAKPETILFAKWLSWNASDCAHEFQAASSAYAGDTSGALDSVATQLQGMVSKTQGFLKMLHEYSGEDGIQKLRNQVDDFMGRGEGELSSAIDGVTGSAGGKEEVEEEAGDEGVSYAKRAMRMPIAEDAIKPQRHAKQASTAVRPKVRAVTRELKRQRSSAKAKANHSLHHRHLLKQEEHGLEKAKAISNLAITSVQMPWALREKELMASSFAMDDPLAAGPAWATVVTTLQELQSVLPTVVQNLKAARSEVSKVAAALDSVFKTFEDVGLPIFFKIARYYRLVWTIYFILLMLLCVTLLYYGFWASGYCGGPKARDPEPERESVWDMTCWEKCKCCCWTTYVCYRDWSEGQGCFWSCICLGQIFVLVLFLVSLVFCLLGGISIFIGTGCASIYMLGDEKVCTEKLLMIQKWIATFDAGHPELFLTDVCSETALTTCAIISDQMTNAAIITISCAILAAVLHFELLISVAMMHERARMKKLIDGMVKDGTLDPAKDEEKLADEPAVA